MARREWMTEPTDSASAYVVPARMLAWYAAPADSASATSLSEPLKPKDVISCPPTSVAALPFGYSLIVCEASKVSSDHFG